MTILYNEIPRRSVRQAGPIRTPAKSQDQYGLLSDDQIVPLLAEICHLKMIIISLSTAKPNRQRSFLKNNRDG